MLGWVGTPTGEARLWKVLRRSFHCPAVKNQFAKDPTRNDSKSVFVDGPIVIGGYDETIHTEPIQSECQITGP